MKYFVMKSLAMILLFSLGLSLILTWHAATEKRVASVQPDTSNTQPKPSLVLIEYNPWAMVIGSDSPTLALYDDGTVIYWKSDGHNGKYLSAKLTDLERSRFLEKINPQAFDSLKNRYEPARGVTDQPEYLIVLRMADGTYKDVYIYGSLKEAKEGGAQTMGLPEALISAFQHITGYDNANAQGWAPDYIEVMIWPYEYAPDKDLIWPREWPGLSDPQTVRRGDMYSLLIEKAKEERLWRFLST